jgi:cyclopropane-fatty-acyl-phospholipid synthase
VYRRTCLGGSLGAAEAYLRREWDADDLAAVLRIFARNGDLSDGLEGSLARPLNLSARVAHRLRRNSPGGSRRNIRDHYDLGDELFSLFLDETMTYSCGVFETPSSTLAEASLAKIDRVCRKLELSPHDHLLEIGSGWGALAIHAAREYGCRVTTTTISRAQHNAVAEWIARAGLGDRITLQMKDYRDLTGRYDKLASIEMIEAVGHGHLDTFFDRCSRLLAADGQMLLQGIVMPEHRHPAYLRAVDFIQAYVFPGSALTSIGSMSRSIGRVTDFRIAHVEDLSPHYAVTLRHWRRRFMSRLPEVRRIGYDDRFTRLWEYYLAYAEAGFAERCTGVVQVLLTKPECRRDAIDAGAVRDARSRSAMRWTAV